MRERIFVHDLDGGAEAAKWADSAYRQGYTIV